MKKMKLTKTLVDSISPGLLEQWVWDTDLPGFGLRCTTQGLKTYVARYRNAQGTQRKQKIARCCDMPPNEARELARKLFAQVAAGVDPMAEKHPAKAPTKPTVEAMFKAYVANMRAKQRESAGEVERALLKAKNSAVAALGASTQACDVKPADIVNYVAEMYLAGNRGAADKHRSYISSAFTWAMKSANDYTVAERQDWGLTINPAADVPRDQGAVGTRDRNLSAPELKKLWQATRPGSPGFAPETAACIRLLIACGQRVQETLRMDGAELDFKEGLWRMPAHKTKGGKLPHTVPLPKQILPELKMLADIRGAGAMFPGRNGDIMPYQSIGQAIGRWLDSSTISMPHFQTRDLRRTWKSRAHDAGVDRFTRDLIQQHAKNDTGSKNYDRAEYLPQMREAMRKWGDWIDANLEDAPNLQIAA